MVLIEDAPEPKVLVVLIPVAKVEFPEEERVPVILKLPVRSELPETFNLPIFALVVMKFSADKSVDENTLPPE